MSNNTIKLLSKAANYAVVHLPERKYPGVVFQGDSLNSLRCRVHKVMKVIENTHNDEAFDEVKAIYEDLSEIEAFYEEICRQNKIDIPYS